MDNWFCLVEMGDRLLGGQASMGSLSPVSIRFAILWASLVAPAIPERPLWLELLGGGTVHLFVPLAGSFLKVEVQERPSSL